MSFQCIGTCGNCGGRVIVPTVWWGIYPPVPSCESCGATPRNHGPVIDMSPPVRPKHKHYAWRSGGSGLKPMWSGSCNLFS